MPKSRESSRNPVGPPLFHPKARPRTLSIPNKMFSGHGEHRNEHEMLMHHADPGFNRIPREDMLIVSPFTRISPPSGL
jgi:hypothetical protein